MIQPDDDQRPTPEGGDHVPPPLPEHKRDAILADVRAVAEGEREQSAAAIAAEHEVGRSTVTKLAAAHGLDHAWNRTHTERASEAKAADNRARRAALASALLDDVTELRRRFFDGYTYVAAGRDGIETTLLDEPPADAVRNYVTAAAVLIDKHLAIERVDVEQEQHAAVDAWLRSITAAAGE